MKYISLLLCSLLTFGVSAQSHSLTAGVGIFNPKLRVQFEHSLNSNKSAGANLTYYLDNWKGPRLEGFYRYYFSDFFYSLSLLHWRVEVFSNYVSFWFCSSIGVVSLIYVFKLTLI